ncbi:MAG TPA: DUF4118 domain-containing protein [Novosphingobium sp.]|nr:DUF4118 domain-containing protein [Novosphingobium sp.]
MDVVVSNVGSPDRVARIAGLEMPRSALTGYLISLALTVLVTLAGLAIFARGNITNIGLLYLLPVLVAATRYGMRTGIVTGLACSLAYNFFFIPPTHTFTIDNPQNIITVLVLLGVAVVGSQLASKVREQALLAQASAAQNSALADFARQLTGVSTADALAQALCAEISRLLSVNAVLLRPGEDGLSVRSAAPPAPVLEMLDIAAARWCFDMGQAAGRGSDALTASEWQFYPIGGASGVLAVIGLSRSDAREPVSPAQLPLLVRLIDQAGLAMARIALTEDMAALAQARERDRLRQALLSSVSHDLRTPLTTILGTLNDMRAQGPEQEVQLAEARAEAERLHRFVDNLLDMARIESGALHQKVEPIDLSEAVASALQDMKRPLAGRQVDVAIASDLPLALVDPQLFHHCLINLIDNAAKHGGSAGGIEVVARQADGAIVLSVADRGPGIPPGEALRIFNTFIRLEGSDRTGGSGLGLAIVKGFAEAMGLSVSAENREDGPGAVFAIRFGPEKMKEVPTA